MIRNGARARSRTRATVSPMCPKPITRINPSGGDGAARSLEGPSRRVRRKARAWLASERNGVAIIVMSAAARNA